MTEKYYFFSKDFDFGMQTYFIISICFYSILIYFLYQLSIWTMTNITATDTDNAKSLIMRESN